MTNIFKSHGQYLRSINLERDWNDPSALENYVFTLQAQQALLNISKGLQSKSSLRAWRITGDYGSGKSLFALLLANIFEKRDYSFSLELRQLIGEGNPALLTETQSKIIPILVTGSRSSLGIAILKGIINACEFNPEFKSIAKNIQSVINDIEVVSDDVVIDWIKKFQQIIIKSRQGDGIAIIIDEAGKFLEFAAAYPDRQDILLLQSLAEISARSNKNPFFVITIFHQGISSYAEKLSRLQQREWEKVAGRYEEITWHYSLDQTLLLIARSLESDFTLIGKNQIESIKADMRQSVELGWYGFNGEIEKLNELSVEVYPLHPTVIPVLVKLFSTFGQNERSLYSFLIGSENFGLMDFVSKTDGNSTFKLHNLYDYARSTFGNKLANLSYYWKTIDQIIASYNSDDESSLELLKTIGIINLINSNALIPSHDIILLATAMQYDNQLSSLVKRRIIHFRGHAGGYCIWPHTSVNLEESYDLATVSLGSVTDIRFFIKNQLSTRPIVARRHYIETGNLRYFEIKYVEVSDIEATYLQNFSGDGLIIVPLCETESDVRTAQKIIIESQLAINNRVLIVVPSALQYLSTYLEEVRKWEWIERTIGELRHDRFAREEVSRQLSNSRLALQAHLQNSVGLTNVTSNSKLNWYYNGCHIDNLTTSKKIMSLLSDICDNIYHESPRVHNELVNRREPSAAATSARQRLLERIFQFSDQFLLGMDREKHPPEMSMYLSVLQEAGLHQFDDQNNIWVLKQPEDEYDQQHCNINPSMRRLDSLLSSSPNKRVRVTEIIDELKKAPYGVREGLIPVLIAVFAVINEQSIAFYEDGTFIPRISGSNFLRLIKAPETFEIQYYPINNIRTSLFNKLLNELGFNQNNLPSIELLDVVKPLIVFFGNLPEYVLYTNSLSPQSQKIRTILKTTTDPVNLLFTDLPLACNVQPNKGQNLDQTAVDIYVGNLKNSIDEMRSSYAKLLIKIQEELLKEFELKDGFEKNRFALAKRASALAVFVTEIRLKSFCLRLADTNLSPELWTESLANLICAMPAPKWRDKDVYRYEQEIHKLCKQFLRVEATVYDKSKKEPSEISVRISLTRPSGEEKDLVVYLSNNEVDMVQELQIKLEKLLEKHGQLGMAAASGVLWKMMDNNN